MSCVVLLTYVFLPVPLLVNAAKDVCEPSARLPSQQHLLKWSDLTNCTG